jgi:predicted nucleic acid-binding protein
VALVIDASIAVAWCIEAEATPDTDAVLHDVRDHGAFVPTLWHLELANVLVQAERRKRITAADIISRLQLISALAITVDHETPIRAWREILALARAERLTTYDAAYLELAVRRTLPLATLDEELAEAAKRLGVSVRP